MGRCHEFGHGGDQRDRQDWEAAGRIGIAERDHGATLGATDGGTADAAGSIDTDGLGLASGMSATGSSTDSKRPVGPAQ